MLYRVHFFPGLCLVILGLALLYQIVRWLVQRYSRRWTIVAAACGSALLLFLAYLLEFNRVVRLFPVWWATWLECAGLVEIACLVGLYLGMLAWRRAPDFSSPRRKFFQTAGAALLVTPIAATGFGIVVRNRFRTSENSHSKSAQRSGWFTNRASDRRPSQPFSERIGICASHRYGQRDTSARGLDDRRPDQPFWRPAGRLYTATRSSPRRRRSAGLSRKPRGIHQVRGLCYAASRPGWHRVPSLPV